MADARRLHELVTRRATADRVVVTGLGVMSSIGRTAPDFWRNCQAGVSGVRRVEGRFDVDAFPSKIASLVPEFEGAPFVDRREARRMARFAHMALAAGHEALADAGLGHALESDRAGVYLGCAVGALDVTQDTVTAMLEKGPMRGVSPFFIVMSPANMAGYHLAHQFRLLGYNNTCTTACAAGTQAIGESAAIIRRGDVDIMLAGGTEAALCEVGVACFCAGNAFSTRNDAPAEASRPFDRDRDGFVGGEGSGIMVLERLDHALARGAKIYGEVLGYGASNDAFHLIAPDPNGAGAVRAIRAALRSAEIEPADVDYVNAHATGTPLGDVAETLAIKAVFGERAYQVPVSATKSMIGHLFGAAGAVEGIATLLALRDGVVPPTINLDNPDEQCDLDYVPHTARRADIRVALSNSFGLGGQNAVVVLARYEGDGAYRP